METIVRLWLLTPILLAVLSTSARGQASDEFLSSFSDNPRGAFQELEQKVVESGIASSRDELSEGLANYTNQYGATHWRTESIKLGIRQLDVLEKLSVDARGRLVDAGRDSAKALELFAQNRFPEALALAKQSLKATETVVGRSNILVAIRLELLGILEYQLLKLGDARAHLRDAVDCWRSAANERHPFLSQLQNNRGAVLTGLGLADEASEVFADARAIAGHTTGPASADYLHPSIALAESSASNGRYEEAYEITESIAGHIEQLEGPNELFLKLRTLQTVLSFARNRDEEKARPLSQRWPWKARKAFIRQTVFNTLTPFPNLASFWLFEKSPGLLETF